MDVPGTNRKRQRGMRERLGTGKRRDRGFGRGSPFLGSSRWRAAAPVGQAHRSRDVVGGYRVEAERNFGLGARAPGTRRRESVLWVNRAGEIPRGIRWSGGGVGMDGTFLLKFRVRGLFIGKFSLGAT